MKFLESIIAPDERVKALAIEHTAALAMPHRAMGEINSLSERLCAISGSLKPDVSRRELFIMAADHGVYEEGIAPYPQEVTMLMVQMMLTGRSAACVYARHNDTSVCLVDIGTKGAVEVPESPFCTFYARKIAKGTANFAKGAAMSREQAEQSVITGYEIAMERIKSENLQLVAIGEMGIANTTASAAIAAAVTGLPAEDVTGFGSGLDEAGRRHKMEIVKTAMDVNKPDKTDPIGLLASLGGFEIGGMAGVILAAASAKIPVVLDGYISTAAAVIAAGLAPASTGYMIASHESEETGHKYLLEMLGLKPLLKLGMRLGEGTGAVCAIPLIEAAAATISEIATLNDAGIN